MDEPAERMYQLMKNESHRLKTFQMNPPWPKDYVDIKKLAKAGFFYAFNGDYVHCAFCRGQVCRWDRNDDPMAEHARHFTTCPFIMGGEVGNEPLGEDPFPGPKRPRPYDVCGTYPNFPPDDPRSGRQHMAQQTQEIHQELSRPEEQNMQQQIQQLHHELPRSEEQYMQPQTQQLQESSQNPYQNQSNSLTGICKICYTNSIEMVFLPCGHSVSCLSCARRLHSCPFCRASITCRIRTYLV